MREEAELPRCGIRHPTGYFGRPELPDLFCRYWNARFFEKNGTTLASMRFPTWLV
jgi:hypothetical protein